MVTLNQQYVVSRIEQLELRRWWLAEQLGINRRTLQRWLNGETEQITEKAAQRLAQHLECSVTDISRQEERVTADEQLRAAKALIASDLLATMAPGHKFALYSQLARTMLVPGLRRDELGELHMSIALAEFRQSHLAAAGEFAIKAQQIAVETNNDQLLLRANMQLSYQRYWQGDASTCLAMDYENLTLAESLGDFRLIAANLSNIADQLVEFGDIPKSLEMQQLAIETYSQVDDRDSTTSALTFCYLGLAIAHFATENVQEARTHVAKARQLATAGRFARGLADCDRLSALYFGYLGEHGPAIAKLKSSQAQYADLGIQEVPVLIDAAKTNYYLGLLKHCKDDLATALKLARDKRSIMLEGLVLRAMCHTGQNVESHRQRAIEIFTHAGLEYQASRLAALSHPVP